MASSPVGSRSGLLQAAMWDAEAASEARERGERRLSDVSKEHRANVVVGDCMDTRECETLRFMNVRVICESMQQLTYHLRSL